MRVRTLASSVETRAGAKVVASGPTKPRGGGTPRGEGGACVRAAEEGEAGGCSVGARRRMSPRILWGLTWCHTHTHTHQCNPINCPVKLLLGSHTPMSTCFLLHSTDHTHNTHTLCCTRTSHSKPRQTHQTRHQHKKNATDKTKQKQCHAAQHVSILVRIT